MDRAANKPIALMDINLRNLRNFTLPPIYVGATKGGRQKRPTPSSGSERHNRFFSFGLSQGIEKSPELHFPSGTVWYAARGFLFLCANCLPKNTDDARPDHSSSSPCSSLDRKKWEKTHWATCRPCLRASKSEKRE